MKRAIVPILVMFLTCGIAGAVTGLLLDRQSSQSVPVKPAPIAKESNTVSYKGVSFTFDRSLASEIESETIPANVDGKPCDIVPEHLAFTLVGYPRRRGMPDNDPHIRVFRITKFREAVSVASKENAKSVVYPPNPPDWTTYFDEEVRTLRAMIAERPSLSNLKSFVVKTRRDRDNTQMPFLPMWEATQAFVSHVRYLNFKNGKGIFFLTQWDTETSQITNEGLEYAFQGITNDGQYYVYAQFSVTAPFLPQVDEPDVVAWNEKNYLLPHKSKEYQTYLRPVLDKLEALPANKFQPSLVLFEQLIGSLQIETESPRKR